MLAYSGWLALSSPDNVPWPFLVQLALFSAATVLHAKVIRRMEFAQRAVQHYERGLARLTGDFSKSASRGERFADPHHPFSGDLDLFGAGGLFERLCHARTREGESTLAGWLLGMDGPPAAPRRMDAAVELSEKLELRERLAVMGKDLKAALHPDALRAWAVADSDLSVSIAPELLRCAIGRGVARSTTRCQRRATGYVCPDVTKPTACQGDGLLMPKAVRTRIGTASSALPSYSRPGSPATRPSVRESLPQRSETRVVVPSGSVRRVPE